MAIRVFDEFDRQDASPARHGERRFEFLNRSASVYFGGVRDLVEDWFSHIPREHQAAMRGALRASDQFDSAYWELYLHEAYLRSGFEIEIHPEIPGQTTQPDFLVGRDDARFYVEAVSVGRATSEVAQDRRLDELYRILAAMLVEDFGLELSSYSIGPSQLPTRRLRNELRTWLEGLDPDEVTAAAMSSLQVGFDRLPEFVWNDNGWRLVFHAIPRGDWARGTPRSALGVMGPGEAQIVDNVTGIRRVLASKNRKYPQLDEPLVIAVQSNTEYPTRDYEVADALYGVSSRAPSERADDPSHLFEEGFWIGRRGWQNAHVPQVLTVYGLAPWYAASVRPRCWRTLDPMATQPEQPPWLTPMIVDQEPKPGSAVLTHEHFGLAQDWPGLLEPDFDLS